MKEGNQNIKIKGNNLLIDNSRQDIRQARSPRKGFFYDRSIRGVSINEDNEIILLAYADDIVILVYSFSDL